MFTLSRWWHGATCYSYDGYLALSLCSTFLPYSSSCMIACVCMYTVDTNVCIFILKFMYECMCVCIYLPLWLSQILKSLLDCSCMNAYVCVCVCTQLVFSLC